MFNIFKLKEEISLLKQKNFQQEQTIFRLQKSLYERDKSISNLKGRVDTLRFTFNVLPFAKACVCSYIEDEKSCVCIGFSDYPGIYIREFRYNEDDLLSKEFAIAQAQYLCDLLNEEL